MKCSKCGFELEATDRICKSCGELNRDNPDNVHIMSLMKHSTNARTNAFQKSIDQNRLRETMPKPEPKEPPKRSSEIIQETRELTEVEKIMMQEGNTYNPTAETPTYYPQHKRTNTDRDYSNEPLLETKKVKVKKQIEFNTPIGLIIVNVLIAALLIYASIKSGAHAVVGVIGTIPTMIYLVSIQLILVKAGEHWWSLFIPVYDIYVLNRVIFGNGWMFLSLAIVPILMYLSTMAGAILFIPVLMGLEAIVALVYVIVGVNRFSNSFGVNSLLVFFFPFIMIPLIAFSRRYTYS